MERWAGKVAVVTGASSGIGSNEHLSRERRSYSSGARPSAGPCRHAGDRKLDDESVLSVIDTNLTGLVMCTRQAAQSMQKRNFNGHIININRGPEEEEDDVWMSVFTRRLWPARLSPCNVRKRDVPFGSTFNVYSSTKHAVTAFSAALLNEFADCNCKIKVTSISLGKVRSSMYEPGDDTVFLEPGDVADCVLYALSTPPNVNIYELGVCSVSEKRL